MVAPCGTTTRTRPVPAPRHPATATVVTSVTARARRVNLRILVTPLLVAGRRRVRVERGKRLHAKRLLKEHRSSQRVHVPLTSAPAAPHLADRTQRGRRG